MRVIEYVVDLFQTSALRFHEEEVDEEDADAINHEIEEVEFLCDVSEEVVTRSF